MKLSCYFLTLVFVTFSDIFPAIASIDVQHIPAGSSILHQRAKRLIFDRNLECALASTAAQCTGGLAQAQADFNVDCDLPNVTLIQQGCRQNSNGDYCAAFTFITVEVLTIISTCRGSDTGECAEDCRDLLMETRSNVGCCINMMLNTTANFLNTGAFSFPLWSNCRVEPITEECTPSSITLRDSDPDADCDAFNNNSLAETFDLSCARSFLEPIQDALMDVGNCEAAIQILSVACTVNQDGERCVLQLETTSNRSGQVNAACTANQETCSQKCREAVETLDNEAGCCINTLIDVVAALGGEESADTAMDSINSIYESCDIEPPGTCEVRLNGAVQATPLALLNGLLIYTALAAYFF